MSIQQDIAAVKNEITVEEQFLTSYVKTEQFIKKYKKIIIAILIVLLAIFGAYKGWEAYLAHKVTVANAAYLKLLANPNDKASQDELQSNGPALYEAYKLSKAIAADDKAALAALAKSANKPIADLADYQQAVLSGDKNAILTFSGKASALKELALINLAYTYIKGGEVAKAKEVLARIPFSSDLKETANYLEHTTILPSSK